jgi:hypothetical protein
VGSLNSLLVSGHWPGESLGREMSFFSRALDFVRGRSAMLARAKREEALGNLSEATALYLEAEAKSEAARVLRMRSDAATDPGQRLLFLSQAIEHAPPAEVRELRVQRARLCLDLARNATRPLTKHELSELANELGSLGESALAADVYALIGDDENQAKMLVEAGAIDRLEQVLDAEHGRERVERARHELHTKIRDLIASGHRRAALALGKQSRLTEEALIAALRDVESRRTIGPRIRLELDGKPNDLAFGDRVIVGRADATLTVPSPAVSREHLELRSGASGPEVVDLGSRNGTLLRGVKLGASLVVHEPTELALGGEVPLVLTPLPDGTLRIECGAETVHAPLGPLLVGGLSFAIAEDGWLELESTTAFLGGLRVNGKIELCHGDEISESADGPVRVKVLS